MKDKIFSAQWFIMFFFMSWISSFFPTSKFAPIKTSHTSQPPVTTTVQWIWWSTNESTTYLKLFTQNCLCYCDDYMLSWVRVATCTVVSKSCEAHTSLATTQDVLATRKHSQLSEPLFLNLLFSRNSNFCCQILRQVQVSAKLWPWWVKKGVKFSSRCLCCLTVCLHSD